MTDTLIPDSARAQIGTEAGRWEGRASQREWQRWAAAVKDRNPLYFDPDAARAAGYRDVIAPPLYVQYVILGVWDLDTLKPDGTPGSPMVDIPGCPRKMAGGDQWRFGAPIYDGDVITAVRTVDDVVEKSGRSGRFVLITWTTRFTNSGDVMVCEQQTKLIARP